MAIDLETVTEPAVLRRMWRDLRGREREVHLTRIPLIRDSTGGVAFDFNLADILLNMKSRISDGTYRPHSPIIVESAKSKLLRRRLSYLCFEDSIILGGLVQAARPSLLARSFEWVSFGRAAGNQTKSENQTITIDYEDWWTKWLSYRNLLDLIERDANPLLVISDITNFFGSIDISLLRNKFGSVNTLDTKATNLLFHLLEHLRPIDDYSPQGAFGLPVVPDDASRIMANFYLADLDEELLSEGQRGGYTRWVDDMVVSVSDSVSAGIVTARIERALSRLGLVPNSSKTELLHKKEFRLQHYVDDNEYLDQVHESTENNRRLPADHEIEFEKRLSCFLNTPVYGNWRRVLQRYYTQSRRIRSRSLLSTWTTHLTDFPAQARNILDYVAFFQGSLEFSEELFLFLKKKGSLFEDIQILLYETLLLKPFLYDEEMCEFILDQTHSHFRGENGFDRPTGYLKGLQSLVMYKFAPSRTPELIKPGFVETTLVYPIFATYGLPLLASDDSQRRYAFEGMGEIHDSRISRVCSLIESLEQGDNRTSGIVLSLLKPKMTASPLRHVINPRVLPLLKIALRTDDRENRKRIIAAMERAYNQILSEGDEDLRDFVTLRHIRKLIDSESTPTL